MLQIWAEWHLRLHHHYSIEHYCQTSVLPSDPIWIFPVFDRTIIYFCSKAAKSEHKTVSSLSKPDRKVQLELLDVSREADNSLFLVEFNVTASCLCRTELLCSGLRPRQHYSSEPAKQYDRYKGEERDRPAAQFRVDSAEKNFFQRSFLGENNFGQRPPPVICTWHAWFT